MATERTSHARSGREDKRERILQGAIEAFAENGFHGTRVSEVARRAGVADGTIYLYFENKNELLEAIFAVTLERFLAAAQSDVYRDDKPVGQMRRLVGEHLRLLGEDRALAAVFQIDLRHSQHFLGEVSRKVLRRYLEQIRAIVESGQKAGLFDAELDPGRTASMVFGVLDQLATSWVLSRRNYKLENLTPEAQQFILRALGAG